MSNTNHNIWTLTVNLGKSLNKGAAKVDAKFYPTPVPTNNVVTNTIVQDVFPPTPPNPDAPSGLGALLLGLFFIGAIFYGVVRWHRRQKI